jgi:hypothetical protein
VSSMETTGGANEQVAAPTAGEGSTTTAAARSDPSTAGRTLRAGTDKFVEAYTGPEGFGTPPGG